MLGVHNVRNSVAAIGVALTVGISIRAIKKGLLSFKGVQRRFNKIFTYNHIDYYDDYAHHPTEIKFVLDGLKKVYKDYEKDLYFSTTQNFKIKRSQKGIFLFIFRC